MDQACFVRNTGQAISIHGNFSPDARKEKYMLTKL